MPHICPWLALLMAFVTCPAQAWTVRLSGSRSQVDNAAVGGVALPDGDLISLTATYAQPGGCSLRAERLEGELGAPRWSIDLGRFAGCPIAGGAAPVPPAGLPALRAANGDVVLGMPDGVVLRLDATTGAERWRQSLSPAPPFQLAFIADLALDGAGNVLVAGSLDASPSEDTYDGDLLVAKLDGTSGAKLWRHTVNGELPACPDPDDCDSDNRPNDAAIGLGVTLDGQIIVAGTMRRPDGRRLTVLRLDTDGGVTASADTLANATALVVDAGHAYVGGDTPAGGIIAAVDLATFTLSTLPSFVGLSSPFTYSSGVAGLTSVAGDDLIVTGWFTPDRAARAAVVARVTPSLGLSVWQRVLAPDSGVAHVPVVTGGNTVAVLRTALIVQTPSNRTEASVAAFDLASGIDRWTTALALPPNESTGVALQILPNGDPVAFGRSGDADESALSITARLSAASGAALWGRYDHGVAGGNDRADAVALDRRGDVVVLGSVEAPDGDDLLVAKLDGRSGESRWRGEVNGIGRYVPNVSFDVGTSVALDPAGDVLAGGALENGGFDTDAAVLKLRGDTGEELWRTLLHAPDQSERDATHDVMSDSAGNALAVVGLNSGSYRIATAVKLAAATGIEQWRTPFPAFNGYAHGALAVTPNDDLVIGGTTYPLGSPAMTIARIAGNTGGPRFQAFVPGAYLEALAASTDRIAIGGARVVSAGEYRPIVALLDLTTGAMQWQHTIVLPTSVAGSASRVTLLPDGDVLVAAQDQRTPDRTTYVARLAHASGAEIWRTVIPSGGPNPSTAVGFFGGLIATPDGRAIAALPLVNGPSFLDFSVAALDVTNGAPRWQFSLDGTATAAPDDDYGFSDYDLAYGLAVGSRGETVAAGITRWEDTGGDATVVARNRLGADQRSGRLLRCERTIARVTRALRHTLERTMPDGGAARAAVKRVGERLGPFLARRCSPELLAQSDACGHSVADLLRPAESTGCLVGAALNAAMSSTAL